MNSQGARGSAPGLKRLMDHVLAVRDPGMRFLRLMSSLEILPPLEAIRTLEALTRSARGGGSRARAVLISLGGFENVRGHLEATTFEAWRLAAVSISSPMAPILSESASQLNAYPSHGININEMLEDMPLGRRKSLARLRDRGMLDRLRHDKHPAVVALLLQNPRLIESDVVLMAASRPTSSEALRVVAAHPKWSRRYKVRSALSQNPYTPPSIGVSLLATLMVPDLKALAKNRKLHRSLRVGARDLLGKRGLILPDIDQEQREAANVNTLDASLAATLDGEGATLAHALLDAQLTLGKGEAGDQGHNEVSVSEGEANLEAEAFLAGLGEEGEIEWPQGMGVDEGRDESDLRDPKSGSGDDEMHIRTASPLGEDRGDQEPEPEEPVVQALAQWFMDTMGPIELIPVEEADDGPSPAPLERELEAYLEPKAGEVTLNMEEGLELDCEGDAELSEEDRAALEFMKNLGTIQLVPVGAGGD